MRNLMEFNWTAWKCKVVFFPNGQLVTGLQEAKQGFYFFHLHQDVTYMQSAPHRLKCKPSWLSIHRWGIGSSHKEQNGVVQSIMV